MKWMSVLGLALFLSACGFTTTEVVEYESVYAPPYEETVVVDYAPVNITTTTIEYY